MKAILAIVMLSLFSLHQQAEAAGVTLNEAVNQVKSEGRILSAKTVNGKHEIKVLTPSGTVKTINKTAANSQVNTKPAKSEYYNRGGRSMRDRKQNTAIPNRFSNQQKNMQLGTRHLDLQPTQNRNKSNKSNKSNKKKKDK